MAEKVDYSKLSDAELEAKAFGRAPDYSKMSDAELEARAFGRPYSPPKMPALEAAGIGLQKGASLGLRPAIAGAGAGLGSFIGHLTTDHPYEGAGDKLQRAWDSIPKAYEEGRREAIGEQEKALADQPMASIAGEIGGGALTIPLTGVKTLGGAAKLGATQGAFDAASTAESLPEAVEKVGAGTLMGAGSFALAKGVAPAAKWAADKTKTGLVKVASALTGETEQNIRTFASRTKEVNKLIEQSGGDISEAADQVRTKLANDIQSFRQSMNAKIGQALDQSSPEKTIDPTSIISGMERIKARINTTLNPEAASQIDEAVNRIKALSGRQYDPFMKKEVVGKLSLRELHDVQDFLSERAKGSYMKGGQIFMPGKDSQLAAKAGSREAKKMMDVLAPEIKDANSKLFQLHRIEDNLNKNLIAPGKSYSALVAAGGNEGNQNRKVLKMLGGLIDKDVVGQAENLAAASAFNNPSILPVGTTGKTVARQVLGAGTGSLLGGPIGGAIGGALTSPMALKAAIQAGQIPRAVIDAIGGNSMTTETLFKYLNTPQGLSAINQAMQKSPVGGAIARRMSDIENRRQAGANEQ